MGLFSFGSKKDKVRKMLESNQIERVVEQASRDKKILNALFELLNEGNPGIVGDSLLALTSILERDKNVVIKNLKKDYVLKFLDLVKSRNSYVKENAMIFLGFLMKENPELFIEYKGEIIDEIRDILMSGNKNDKAFASLMIKEFKLAELKPYVEELVNVQEKVILPFEGMKWIPLGEIAKDALRELER
ncbi:hypothetical protein E3E31_04425 [Thermococcus sp. M39]|uniref:hypothetical protein n=1 Tax=unclassified Thermococcus TaxID=2627626 RepID=UPI00143BBE0B|nr:MULTISPECIES: hypothetical protein [unclassified Thermococcus]NJE07776.1 hypothetical protein [Thermococcus sp. M39]NJE12331.1 hypothetical protein [Thermococcus sp. LS2]